MIKNLPIITAITVLVTTAVVIGLTWYFHGAILGCSLLLIEAQVLLALSASGKLLLSLGRQQLHQPDDVSPGVTADQPLPRGQ